MSDTGPPSPHVYDVSRRNHQSAILGFEVQAPLVVNTNSPTAAARELGVHHKTVAYRVRQGRAPARPTPDPQPPGHRGRAPDRRHDPVR